MSLLASCRLHDIEPWSYLRDVFCLLPDWSPHRMLELAPLNWKTTAQLDDVVETLVAYRYRAATLIDT